MTEDTYNNFAERYDLMMWENPARRAFFKQLFIRHNVKEVLDCACGTGHDLIMFNELGVKVSGSDLSESMLKLSRKKLAQEKIEISLQKLDYRYLPSHWSERFDAVVCLTNSINEPLRDAETLMALKSMRSVLRSGGILVFDQGQTDASMQKPPRFAPVINNPDFTRFFVMEYEGNIQTVHIFDFIHTQETCNYQHDSVQIRIRLQDSWEKILSEAGFTESEFIGDWNSTPYNKDSSSRLIVISKK